MPHVSFEQIFQVGGHANSLGRAGEVVAQVLADHSRLEELYQCVSASDAWVRMRAIDTFEKVARIHPDWCKEYVDRILADHITSTQPSIQWHMAELFVDLPLTTTQTTRAAQWIEATLDSQQIDWIVAVNCMKALWLFVERGAISVARAAELLAVQAEHSSKTVRKKAAAYQAALP